MIQYKFTVPNEMKDFSHVVAKGKHLATAQQSKNYQRQTKMDDESEQICNFIVTTE